MCESSATTENSPLTTKFRANRYCPRRLSMGEKLSGFFCNHETRSQPNPLGALAHLQLGRAYAMAGATAKAKAAYQDFFTLWKDADPDIPILKRAKAEYSKLQ